MPGGSVPVKIKANSHQFIPLYKTAGSAAVDLIANIDPIEFPNGITITPNSIVTIDCGISIQLPPGWEAQIRSRSSLALKGIQVTNGIGTIDSDFTGSLKVVLNNCGREIVIIKHMQRFAQMALKPTYVFQWNVCDALEPTQRTGGFGSTGSF